MKIGLMIVFVSLQSFAVSNITLKPALLLTRAVSNPKKTAAFGGFLFLSSTVTFFPAAWIGYSMKIYMAEGKNMADATASQAFIAVTGTVLAGATAFLWGQGLFHLADAVVSEIFNPPI